MKASVISFMPYSFIAVDKVGGEYAALEKRHNYTTPKSFLELISLYRSMLNQRRNETNMLIDRYGRPSSPGQTTELKPYF